MRKLRESTGLNRKEFCERYGIPYRTMTEWELGQRHAPEYVLRLLTYYIRTQEIRDGQEEELRGARKQEVVLDEDCPEVTPEKAVRFRRVNPKKPD